MQTKTDRILSYLPATFRALPLPTALHAVVDACGEQLLEAENGLGAVMLAHWVDHADLGAEFITDLGCFAALYGLGPRGAAKDVARYQSPTCLPVSADETIEEFREHLKRYVGTFLDGTVTVQGILRIVAEALGLHIADQYADMDTWWTRGTDLLVSVEHAAGDASELLFGKGPLRAQGSGAIAAHVLGPKLAGSLHLYSGSSLRIKVDDREPVHVNLAAHGASSTLDHVVATINQSFPAPIAGNVGGRLKLASPTIGAGSRLEVIEVDNDAAEILLDLRPSASRGRPARAASATGRADLSGTLDLRERRYLRLLIDRKYLAEIDCAAPDPAATTLSEIVAAINDGFGMAVAFASGHFLKIVSPTLGVESDIEFEASAAQDAREFLFGDLEVTPRESAKPAVADDVQAPEPPRIFQGRDAASAAVAGRQDLSRSVDLRTRHLLRVAIDGARATDIDLWQASRDLSAVSLQEIRAALDRALGPGIAVDHGKHLILTSTGKAGASSIAILPVQETRTRRFVTRAYIKDEAPQKIFGILHGKAVGSDSVPARLHSAVDLSRGIDLREKRYLQIFVDKRKPKEIDCARGVRIPRNAGLAEIVDSINAQLGESIAAHDGTRITLASLARGEEAAIAVGGPSPGWQVLGLSPGHHIGINASGIFFEGTVNLNAGIDLRRADRIRIGVDGRAPVEIACAGPHPAQTSLNDIVENINLALGTAVASHTGKHVVLAAKPAMNQRARLEFATPPSRDATAVIFGFTPPRVYLGAGPSKVVLMGSADLSKGIDLTVRPLLLRLSVDGGAVVEVDCAKESADPSNVSVGEIVKALNHALGAPVASSHGTRLLLSSTKTGRASALVLESDPPGSACEALGFRPLDEVIGTPPTHAVISGPAFYSADLSKGRTLRLSVDGAAPVDIDVAGGDPETTSLHEVVARINAVLPGVASVSERNGVSLRSPAAGAQSSLEILPARALELIDYPPVPMNQPPRAVHSAGRFNVDNDGAAATQLAFVVTAPQGESGMEFVNRTAGTRIRVMAVLRPNDRLSLRQCAQLSVEAIVTEPDGSSHTVPDSSILVGKFGAEAFVPFSGDWPLTNGAGADSPAQLQLNDPSAEGVVVLRARDDLAPGDVVVVKVAPGRLTRDSGQGTQLFDVTLRLADRRPALIEKYSSVTIGRGPTPNSLALELTKAPSRLVRAEEFVKTDVFELPQGRSEFTYMNCHEARFDLAWFPDGPNAGGEVPAAADQTRFAGGGCREWAVFDLSRFANSPPEGEVAYFGHPVLSDPPVEVEVQWTNYQPGAFVVNLPADLGEEFGSRFDQDRFGLPSGQPETFNGVITEPATDRDYIVKRLNARSTLVVASPLEKEVPPPGFEATRMPFLHPRSRTLSGGTDTAFARIYLAEDGVPGLIELRAREKGPWGNTIAVTSKQAGPVRFDITVGYEGLHFESARQVALAGRILRPHEDPLAQLTSQILKPGPVGVLQAKAAGVRAEVTRDRTEVPPQEDPCPPISDGKVQRRKQDGKSSYPIHSA